MDAKRFDQITNWLADGCPEPEQPIKTIDLKEAKELMLIVVDTDGKVETVGTSYLKQFFEYIESQAREAEIGSTGVKLIAAERQRQIEKEGWTPDHDRQHIGDELIYAALCYAIDDVYKDEFVSSFWPWDKKWWKPTPHDRIRELQKAGALIAAEIDRLRAGKEAGE